MRKLKLISVVASILCILMLCTACATPKAKISNYLNPDYVPEESVLAKYNYLSDLEGYILGEHNSYFAVFEKLPDVTDGALPTELTTTYKIFSMTKASVIATFSAANTLHNIDLYEDIPIVCVTKSYVDLLDASKNNTSYVAYDANGTQILSTEHAVRDPYEFADLVIFNYAAYSVDEKTGAISKQCDVPEFLQLKECDHYNSEYFYVINDSYTQVIVYDREFDLVSTWTAPSYVDNAAIMPLNDGNVFIQYTYALDSEEKKFDFYKTNDNLTVKYDLVSLIFNTTKGSTTEKELDFVVQYITTNESLQRNADESNPKYSEKFENIAYICPIIDKRVDSSTDAMDIVLMSNKLKVQKSLKIVDNQSSGSLPTKVAEDLYGVRLKKGYALVNGKGDLINLLNTSTFGMTNDYLVGEAAIYNYDLTKAYDLVENDATIKGYIGDSILVRAYTSTGYDIVLLNDGAQKTVFTHTDGDIAPKLVFGDELGNGFYYVYNTEIDEYTYYNAKGDVIITTASKLEVVGNTDGDNLLLVGINDALVSNYFAFTQN